VLPIILLILSGSLLLTENTFINAIAYAQQQQPHNTTTAANNIGVKITSPTKGQQVPIGILKVEGTSTAGQDLDEELHTDCKVSVILNDIKPYQPVIPTGSGRQNNYSTWSYTLTPNYATIEQGVNKITSKLSCDNDIIAKWYSVNVTGIAGGQGGQEGQEGQQLSNPIPLPTVSSEGPDSDIDNEEYDTFFGKDPFFKDEK
jgi:hypothetical protein